MEAKNSNIKDIAYCNHLLRKKYNAKLKCLPVIVINSSTQDDMWFQAVIDDAQKI